MRKNLYDESKEDLKSLVKQIIQVGIGLIGVLLVTGGKPSPLILGSSVLGGVTFVAYSEIKRRDNEQI